MLACAPFSVPLTVNTTGTKVHGRVKMVVPYDNATGSHLVGSVEEDTTLKGRECEAPEVRKHGVARGCRQLLMDTCD